MTFDKLLEDNIFNYQHDYLLKPVFISWCRWLFEHWRVWDSLHAIVEWKYIREDYYV